jgi:hypothetical protein
MKRAVVFWRSFGTSNLSDFCRITWLIRHDVRLRHGPTPATPRQQERSAHHDEQQFGFHRPTEIEVRCRVAFAALAPSTLVIFGKRAARYEDQQTREKENAERSHRKLLLARTRRERR